MTSSALQKKRNSAAAVALLLVISGCAGGPVPWHEDGVLMGTLTVTSLPDGKRYDYRDRANRLVRIERRDVSGNLDPDHPVEHREYQASQTLATDKHFTDSSGRPTLGPEGFSRWRSRREPGESGESLVHHEHFDTHEQPMKIPAGYFRETFTRRGGRLLHRRYFDPDGEPVSIEVGQWAGVREIQYAYLKGASPIVMQMLVGEDGEPIHKEKISGTTRKRWDQYHYNYQFR